MAKDFDFSGDTIVYVFKSERGGFFYAASGSGGAGELSTADDMYKLFQEIDIAGAKAEFGRPPSSQKPDE